VQFLFGFFDIQDLLILSVGYFYVLTVIGLGIVIQKSMKMDAKFTRKVIHLFAGFAIYTVPFYTHAYTANLISVPMLLLIYLINPKSKLSFAKNAFEAMASERDYKRGHLMGPFYYAISINIFTLSFTLIPSLVPFYWIPAAGLTALFLGDGIAPLIGRMERKRHKYTFFGSERSIEGSLAMLAGSILGICFAFYFLGYVGLGVITLNFQSWIPVVSIAAIVGTLIEAITPGGFDNLSIPVGVIATLILILPVFGFL
jgi:dolichol kinase